MPYVWEPAREKGNGGTRWNGGIGALKAEVVSPDGPKSMGDADRAGESSKLMPGLI